MLWCAILFFLVLPQNDLLSLGGSVFDPDSKPAGNVLVRLDQPTEQKQWETTTQADGAFRFDHLSYGTYRLAIHKDGYFDVSSEVRLESSKTVEFTLAAADKLEQEIDVVDVQVEQRAAGALQVGEEVPSPRGSARDSFEECTLGRAEAARAGHVQLLVVKPVAYQIAPHFVHIAMQCDPDASILQ